LKAHSYHFSLILVGFDGGRSAMLFEVVSQQNCGRQIVNRRTLSAFVALRDGPNLPRFPSREPFIHKFNFETKLFAKSLGEPGRFVRHFTRFARHVQRVADDNPRNSMAAAGFTQTPQVSLAIGAKQRPERLRRQAKFVRKRKANPLPAVVNRENSVSRVCLG
jgi:hypothetical protein